MNQESRVHQSSFNHYHIGRAGLDEGEVRTLGHGVVTFGEGGASVVNVHGSFFTCSQQTVVNVLVLSSPVANKP